MKNIDKEIIREDLEFIQEYICTLLDEHPELGKTNEDIFTKIERRLKDIERRVGA